MDQNEKPATIEDILAQHRRERKELQAKIQELKKNAPKSDKKKRKEAMEHILQLEHELEHRQAEELKAAHAKSDGIETEEPSADTETATKDNHNDNDVEATDVANAQRVTKAQKRRDKKTREARQLEEEVRAAAADSHNTPKAIEARKICEKLKGCNLSPHLILSDGNCLYNSVRHQLQLHGVGAYSVDELRNRTADYMLENKDNFACYSSETDFQKYCDNVRNTTLWGGQLELKALSGIYGVPIEVLQAEGPPSMLGEHEKGPKLIITYHRHMYSMGEHYNSTQPLTTSTDANDDI